MAPGDRGRDNPGISAVVNDIIRAVPKKPHIFAGGDRGLPSARRSRRHPAFLPIGREGTPDRDKARTQELSRLPT